MDDKMDDGESVSVGTFLDKVLKKGYRDKQEDTFVYLMKKELILENGQKSAGFILEEENR